MNDLALLTEAEKLARVTEEMSSSYALELSRVLRDLERQLRSLAIDALAGSKTALSRAVRAAKLRKQVQQALEASGYPELADAFTSWRLDTLVAQVEKLRGAAKLAQFSTSDLSRILALKDLARLDLLKQGAEISHAIWRTVAYGLITQRPASQLLQDLADAIDVEIAEARTLYDTTVNVFARQIEASKSREGDVYAYMGPADIKTRPFCHQHVGKVYTKDEIDAMENGQLPNVFLTGGGYNCRHQWIAVSKVSELRDLVGTDQRMPEVEKQLVEMGNRKAA